MSIIKQLGPIFSFAIQLSAAFKKETRTAKILTITCSSLTLLFLFTTGYLLSKIHDVRPSNIVFISLFCLVVSISIFNCLYEIQTKIISISALDKIMPKLWQQLLSLPFSRFRDKNASEITAMFSDYESALYAFINTLFNAINYSILLILLLGIMLYHQPALTFIYITIYLIIILLKISIFYNHKLFNQLKFRSLSVLSHFLYECLLQISKIRTSGIETTAYQKWLALKAEHIKDAYRAETIEIKNSILDSATPAIIALALYGYFYLSHPEKITSSLLYFLLFSAQFSLLFEKLSATCTHIFHIHNDFNRLHLFLSPALEKEPVSDTQYLFGGKIELKDVSLNHPCKNILDRVSLTIEPGSHIGLIGHSGAGKSSIFRLILGLEKPSSGNIFIDGISIHHINLPDLRKQFGVVLQSTAIFPGSIFSNIAASHRISLDEAWQLAHDIGLADEINAMPMKMFTHISDNANDTLSGGQKQKILIARALAAKPKILLLDEATSALDNDSQARIFNHLRSLNITLFVIAHRYSTIMNADNIYYLKQGRIIANGSYNQLLATGFIDRPIH